MGEVKMRERGKEEIFRKRKIEEREGRNSGEHLPLNIDLRGTHREEAKSQIERGKQRGRQFGSEKEKEVKEEIAVFI